MLGRLLLPVQLRPPVLSNSSCSNDAFMRGSRPSIAAEMLIKSEGATYGS